MGLKAEDFGKVLGSMTEAWPEVQGDRRSISACFGGYSLLQSVPTFPSHFSTPRNAWYVLYLEMTLKVFNNCYAQMQTNQNRATAVLGLGLGGPCFGITGKVWVKEMLKERLRRKCLRRD